MDKQSIRFFLLSMIIFIGWTLFSKYKEERNATESIKFTKKISQQHSAEDNLANIQEIPNPIINEATNSKIKENVTGSNVNSHITKFNHHLVMVETDLLTVKINSYGDVIFAELKQYPKQANGLQGGFNLLDQSNERFYIAQSGLGSELGPDSKIHGRTKFVSTKSVYTMSPDQTKIMVDLTCQSPVNSNINFIKRFTFNQGSYVIKVEYIIINNSDIEFLGSMYGKLKRNQEKSNQSIFSGSLRTYTGAAISTAEEKYKKISFSDMKTPYRISVSGGWIAMLEHYFVSAWIPDHDNFTEYQTEKLSDSSYAIRFVNSSIKVAPGTTKSIEARLFIGPKVVDILKQVAPSLDLTVDYGILWWLCAPLFWLLKNIFKLIGNWGWAIIFTTLMVKLLFYKLSAYSYKSMGNLRKLQPKIEELKATYGSDRQKFSLAIMELYKKEKVNPLGGCLPILLQIPVFISLYYVLLESVELRQAHWCLWIKDLSLKDPLYILPILMGISMFLQQKMNPPPADPTQAKVLMAMPLLFIALFLNFPSGLMLYWIVNNSLSILQQFFIMKSLERSVTSTSFKRT